MDGIAAVGIGNGCAERNIRRCIGGWWA